MGKIKVSDRNVQLPQEIQQKIAMRFAGGGITRTALAEEFGISRRTASRVILLQQDYVEQQLKRTKTSKGKGGERAKKPDSPQEVKPAWTVAYTNKFVSITRIDGKSVTVTVTKANPQFALVHASVVSGNYEKAFRQASIKTAIIDYSDDKFVISGEQVQYKGMIVENGAIKRVIENMQQGKPFVHLLRFFDRCASNPNPKVIQRLFEFLDHNDIEIDKDGYFIAWKKVSANYMDLYTGMMDNSPGKVVRVKRSECDDRDNVTCSRGLHVCAKGYLNKYASSHKTARIVKVKVNPRHVVSIPIDYNNMKLRCYRYKVIADCTHEV